MTDTQNALSGAERLAFEKAAVAPFVGAFGWRTIVNLVWPIVGWVSVVTAAMTDRLPMFAGVVLAAVFLQALYMPAHEAVHGTISAGRPQFAWVDRLVGIVSSTLLGASFEAHRIGHLKHHTHTNDERDPDLLYAKGSMVQVAATVIGGAAMILPVIFLGMIPGGMRLIPAPVRNLLELADELRGPEATRVATRFGRLQLGVVVLSFIAGFGTQLVLLWIVAASLSHVWLAIVFAWLPHHPHSEVGRYRDTRIFTFRSSTWLIRGHDHHLLHHLFPRVPHYRLRDLWEEMGPHLEEQNARIEGRAARTLSQGL